MNYNLDLKYISIESYKEILKNQNLLPSRRCLLTNIDKYFAILDKKGINNVYQLKMLLSTPVKIDAFSLESGIPQDYLIILKREIGGLEQKPVLLSTFPDMENELISKLYLEGIKTSKDYFESKIKSETDELYCLCDLVRINGIGPVAAKMFFEAGYKSALAFAKASAEELLNKITAVNSINNYYKGNLGLKDMEFCITYAKLLMRYVK
ncbi:MAG: DUF4332 domain-containing protein [Clostridia bacterium]|nr:DUF4332 domain-containing protein [Clostridia bacterium]